MTLAVAEALTPNKQVIQLYVLALKMALDADRA